MATETRRCQVLASKCPLFTSSFLRHISDNPQYHTPSWSQNKAKENISVLPDAAYATFDGVVEMWMLNEKCFQDAIDGMPAALLFSGVVPMIGHQLIRLLDRSILRGRRES